MIKNLTCAFLFLCVIQITPAQIDKSDNNYNLTKGSIGRQNNNLPKEKPASLYFDKQHNGFKTAKQEQDYKERKKEKEKALQVQGIITPEMLSKQAFQKNIEGNLHNFPQIDIDLGSFHTKSKNTYILSYDYGRFDGDKVQITVNGKRIHNNYLLTPKLKSIKIPLEIGINKIEVTALNEGDLSPNTAYFNFIDENKSSIKEGQWLLATGAKVIAIIVRDPL